MKVSRKFIHGELFEKQWKELGLTDENLRELQSILLENLKLVLLCKAPAVSEKSVIAMEIEANPTVPGFVMLILKLKVQFSLLWYLRKMRWKISPKLKRTTSNY